MIGFYYDDRGWASNHVFYPDGCPSAQPYEQTFCFIGLTDENFNATAMIHGDGNKYLKDVLTNRCFWFEMDKHGRPNGNVWPDDARDNTYVFDKM
jgi:hypothetical protein